MKLYNELLEVVPKVATPNSTFNDVTPFLYYIRVPSNYRNQLRAYLESKGIDTGVHWQPGHWFELFKNCKSGDLGVTEGIANEIISLPLHSCMDLNNVEYICAEITKFMCDS